MGGDSGAGGRAGGAMCSRFGVAFYVNLNGATISPFTYVLMGFLARGVVRARGRSGQVGHKQLCVKSKRQKIRGNLYPGKRKWEGGRKCFIYVYASVQVQLCEAR